MTQREKIYLEALQQIKDARPAGTIGYIAHLAIERANDVKRDLLEVKLPSISRDEDGNLKWDTVKYERCCDE